jgi:hypothetical protein
MSAPTAAKSVLRAIHDRATTIGYAEGGDTAAAVTQRPGSFTSPVVAVALENPSPITTRIWARLA